MAVSLYLCPGMTIHEGNNPDTPTVVPHGCASIRDYAPATVNLPGGMNFYKDEGEGK